MKISKILAPLVMAATVFAGVTGTAAADFADGDLTLYSESEFRGIAKKVGPRLGCQTLRDGFFTQSAKNESGFTARIYEYKDCAGDPSPPFFPGDAISNIEPGFRVWSVSFSQI